MRISVCRTHRACLVHREETRAHRECSRKIVYLPDKSGRGAWLPEDRNEGGSWTLRICRRCRYCRISDRVDETCPRCFKPDMIVSHRKNNGVIDGFIDADSQLTRLAVDLFWSKGCCFACRKSYSSARNLLSHLKVSPLNSFYSGSKWVLSKFQSHRTKCTGLFVCCQCLLSGHLNVWKDKFAYKDYGQLCFKCHSDLFIKPVMMWQGTSNMSKPVYDVSEHDQSRCEACYLNKCIYV